RRARDRELPRDAGQDGVARVPLGEANREGPAPAVPALVRAPGLHGDVQPHALRGRGAEGPAPVEGRGAGGALAPRPASLGPRNPGRRLTHGADVRELPRARIPPEAAEPAL